MKRQTLPVVRRAPDPYEGLVEYLDGCCGMGPNWCDCWEEPWGDGWGSEPGVDYELYDRILSSRRPLKTPLREIFRAA